MKKRIISSLCAAAVMAFAAVSWGAGIYVENSAQGFGFFAAGGTADVSVGATTSNVLISATDNGTTVSPVLLPDETYSNGKVWMQVNSTVDPTPVSINASGEVPLVSANGYVSLQPSATASGASFVTVASFTQLFSVLTADAVSVSGEFNHHWIGSPIAGPFTNESTYRDVWGIYLYDLVNGTVGAQVAGGDTGLIFFNTLPNGGQDLAIFNASVPAVGDYILMVDATAFGGLAASAVPEPGTFILAGSGLIGLIALRRRSRKQA